MSVSDWDTATDERRFLGACFEYFGPTAPRIDYLMKLLDSGVDEDWFVDPDNRHLYLGLFKMAILLGQPGVTVRLGAVFDEAEKMSGEIGWVRDRARECSDAASFLNFDDLIEKEIPLWWTKLKKPKVNEILGSLTLQLNMTAARPGGMEEIGRLLEKASETWAALPALKAVEAGLLDRTRKKALEPLPINSFIRTGIDKLDDIVLGGGLSGFGAPDSGKLIIACGRPGQGKTQLAVNLAMRVAACGHNVGFWSLEMQDEQIALRMIAAYDHFQALGAGKVIGGPITYGMLKSRSYNPFVRERLELENYAAIDENLNVYKGSNNLTPEVLCHHMRVYAKRKPDTRLLVVDHLGLLSIPSKGNRATDVGEATRLIKTTAVDIGIDVLLLAQLNRNVEQRAADQRMPSMSDLRDSGRIEEDADIILGLNRPYYYDNTNESLAHVLELGILKNRQGASGVIEAGINLDCCAIYNV